MSGTASGRRAVGGGEGVDTGRRVNTGAAAGDDASHSHLSITCHTSLWLPSSLPPALTRLGKEMTNAARTTSLPNMQERRTGTLATPLIAIARRKAVKRCSGCFFFLSHS